MKDFCKGFVIGLSNAGCVMVGLVGVLIVAALIMLRAPVRAAGWVLDTLIDLFAALVAASEDAFL